MTILRYKKSLAAFVLAGALTIPSLAHDGAKAIEHQEKKENHMMMKAGDGHMDQMQMHQKMMAKMKSCMMAKMKADTETDAAKVRTNMMSQMEDCMMGMMKTSTSAKKHDHKSDKKDSGGHKH